LGRRAIRRERYREKRQRYESSNMHDCPSAA
jgi:hypothetical protein